MTLGTVLIVIFFWHWGRFSVSAFPMPSMVPSVVLIFIFTDCLLQFWSSLWSSSSFLLIVCCNFGPLCGPHPHFTDHLLQFWSSLWSSSSFSLIVFCNYDPLMYPHPSALRRWMPSHDLAQKNRRGSGFGKGASHWRKPVILYPFPETGTSILFVLD